ncbi:8-oxoguanine DNA glycosylase [Flavobacterium suzhouense]|uniref:HhH-GPD domain-containing protein n=1 Tax=Flavobacterium suzhouense TaxID=1529638 RepID=A0ABW5NU95_9FLAO
MKTLLYNNEHAWQELCHHAAQLPNENDELLPGLKWGDCSQLYTPAFWKMQYISHKQSDVTNKIYKLGTTILEEIVVCLLGGFGMPSELGLAAFHRLKQNNLIKPKISFEEIYQALYDPFTFADGRKVRYRFYNQKARYLHQLLNRNDLDLIPVEDDIQFRKWLLTVDGIGLKTASWITRNCLNSDNVAILDIHILRAGVLAGFYDDTIDNLDKHYLTLEQKYLDFCNALDVSSAIMDAIIWEFMKKNNKLALNALKHSN